MIFVNKSDVALDCVVDPLEDLVSVVQSGDVSGASEVSVRALQQPDDLVVPACNCEVDCRLPFLVALLNVCPVQVEVLDRKSVV